MYGRILFSKNSIFARGHAVNQLSKQFSTHNGANTKISKWIWLISGATAASSVGYFVFQNLKNANRVYALQQRRVTIINRFYISDESLNDFRMS